MTINEKIRIRRKEIGFSADEVAEKIGISRATLYRYESGQIEKIPTSVIESLSKILKISPMSLMGIDNDAEDISFDEFTYALYDELKELSTDDKRQLLAMARFMKNENKSKKGKKKKYNDF